MTLSTAEFQVMGQGTAPVSFASTEPVRKLVKAEPASLSPTDRDRLLVEHLPVVRFIARRMHERLPKHVEPDELVSAGTVGLVDALSKFDGGKQVQFKSYAQFRIRGATLDFLRSLDWSPRELRRKGRDLEGVVQVLVAKLGRTPVDTEIAAEMGLPLETYQLLTGELKSLEIGSLNAERNEESGEEELAYLAAPSTDDPLFQCMQGQLRSRLVEAIEDLPEKERLVLTLYYFEELTMKEIGLTLGVVESRVSQIRAAATARLRTAMGVSQANPKKTQAKHRPN